MLAHIAGDAATAIAADEDHLRIWVTRDRDVSDHLLVPEADLKDCLEDVRMRAG